MAQSDYQIEDISHALTALLTLNSGSSEPSVTHPFMLWMDSSSTPAVLKQRTAANDGWVEFLKGVEGTAPIGSVTALASTMAPAGWLVCDGAEVSRTNYADLFGVIGETFGAGDGTTTFKLPDLRGEFIRGLDSGRGADADRNLGSSQDWAVENITGGFATFSWGGDNLITHPYGAFVSDYNIGNTTSAHAGHGHSGSEQGASFDASRVVKTSTETRPRNVALTYIIKY